MANYATLITAIQQVIKTNGNNEITGAILQSSLLSMINSLGAGYQFVGLATPSTNPGTPDIREFYIANGAGTYSNFGLTVNDGEFAILVFDSQWSKLSVSSLSDCLKYTAQSLTDVQKAQARNNIDVYAKSFIDENKADKDGTYDSMIVGSAKGLIGYKSVGALLTRRTSGGNDDIGSGAAQIQRIKGNTVRLNQQANPSAYASAYGYSCTFSNGLFTLTNNSATTPDFGNFNNLNFRCKQGHKYIVICDSPHTQIGINTANAITNSFVPGNTLFTAAANSVSDVLLRTSAVISSLAVGISITFHLFVCDLTQMYGADNEPSSVEEFTSQFDRPFYAYNPNGTILHNVATALLTNGFNQWDEDWELGTFNSQGEPTASNDLIRSKNFCPISGRITMRMIDNNAQILLYDENKTYIDCFSFYGESRVLDCPANTKYFKIKFLPAYGISYKNDCCISYTHSGIRNGEYEQYWQNQLSLPITTAKGKLNGQGSSIVIFADGLKSAGSSFDEMQSAQAIRRIGTIYLDGLQWFYDGNVFYADSPIFNNNYICSSYTKLAADVDPADMSDKSMTIHTDDNTLYIKDDDYDNVQDFVDDLANVKAFYELQSPQIYVLDEEITMNYRVSDWGTEWMLPENGETPTTAPFSMDVIYAINAVDTIRNINVNHPNKDSITNLLNAMQSSGVISAYTMTYNNNTGAYTFTITR